MTSERNNSIVTQSDSAVRAEELDRMAAELSESSGETECAAWALAHGPRLIAAARASAAPASGVATEAMVDAARVVLDRRVDVTWHISDDTVQEIVNAALAAAAKSDVGLMREALEQWPCPSCGGAKTYTNRSRERGEEKVPCKICEQTGLHPIANAALAARTGDQEETS